MLLYSSIILKFSLGIICLIIQINIMGKGNLAPASAMDQVQNYVLGGIIGGVIYNDSITVLQFILVLIICVHIHSSCLVDFVLADFKVFKRT